VRERWMEWDGMERGCIVYSGFFFLSFFSMCETQRHLHYIHIPTPPQPRPSAWDDDAPTGRADASAACKRTERNVGWKGVDQCTHRHTRPGR
jgi:hypothetical protein